MGDFYYIYIYIYMFTTLFWRKSIIIHIYETLGNYSWVARNTPWGRPSEMNAVKEDCLLWMPDYSIGPGSSIARLALDARLPDWASPERGQIGSIGLECPITQLAMDARLPDWPWMPDCLIGPDAGLPDWSRRPIAGLTASSRLVPDCFPPSSKTITLYT